MVYPRNPTEVGLQLGLVEAQRSAPLQTTLASRSKRLLGGEAGDVDAPDVVAPNSDW